MSSATAGPAAAGCRLRASRRVTRRQVDLGDVEHHHRTAAAGRSGGSRSARRSSRRRATAPASSWRKVMVPDSVAVTSSRRTSVASAKVTASSTSGAIPCASAIRPSPAIVPLAPSLPRSVSATAPAPVERACSDRRSITVSVTKCSKRPLLSRRLAAELGRRHGAGEGEVDVRVAGQPLLGQRHQLPQPRHRAGPGQPAAERRLLRNLHRQRPGIDARRHAGVERERAAAEARDANLHRRRAAAEARGRGRLQGRRLGHRARRGRR